MLSASSQAAVVREYEPQSDFDGLRACVIALQDYEHALDARYPDGAAIVDAYVPDVLRRCHEHEGAILVADMDGEVAGYVMVWTRVEGEDVEDGDFVCGRIADLVVRSEFRGRGLGRCLLRAGEDYARTHGVVHLRLGVLASNLPARQLYETSGFEPCNLELEKRLSPEE